MPLAYGLVPGPGRYRAQVATAVHAAALNGCDALLVACSGGVPGTCSGREVVAVEEAAEIWASVLCENALQHFKQVVFCFGRGGAWGFGLRGGQLGAFRALKKWWWSSKMNLLLA